MQSHFLRKAALSPDTTDSPSLLTVPPAGSKVLISWLAIKYLARRTSGWRPAYLLSYRDI